MNEPTATMILLLCAACALIATAAAVGVWARSSRTDKQIEAVQKSIARIEGDTPHYLTARNLGPLHEKINGVAQNVAEARAEIRATGEQLRVITRHLLKSDP